MSRDFFLERYLQSPQTVLGCKLTVNSSYAALPPFSGVNYCNSSLPTFPTPPPTLPLPSHPPPHTHTPPVGGGGSCGGGVGAGGGGVGGGLGWGGWASTYVTARPFFLTRLPMAGVPLSL